MMDHRGLLDANVELGMALVEGLVIATDVVLAYEADDPALLKNAMARLKTWMNKSEKKEGEP